MNTRILIGKRVRLAAFDAERDAEYMARWAQDSEYQQLGSSGPSTLWSTKQVKDWAEKHYAEMYSFTIFALANDPASEPDRVIGNIDLSGINWTAGDAWVGVAIGERDYWGKGYGTEAMNLLLDFAFSSLNLRRVSLNVFEYNPRAYKCYLKTGFREEGRMRQWMQRAGARYDLIHMGILREEWEALQGLAPETAPNQPDLA